MEVDQTVTLVREIGGVVDTLGVMGILLLLAVWFVTGRIHSDKSVDKMVGPYKARLDAVDNGFNARLESMERATVGNEANTKRMADFLETMVATQEERRDREIESRTRLTTILETLQVPVRRRKGA